MVRTERLTIRPLEYYELVSRVYGHIGLVTNDEERDKVIDYTLKPMKAAPVKDHIYYTFWVAEDNGVEVAEVGFLRPPNESGVLEIWCHTRVEHMNKGYGTEAIKGLTRWATANDNVRFVCAGIDKDNKPSQRMIKKAGFYYLTEMNNQFVFNFNTKNN